MITLTKNYKQYKVLEYVAASPRCYTDIIKFAYELSYGKGSFNNSYSKKDSELLRDWVRLLRYEYNLPAYTTKLHGAYILSDEGKKKLRILAEEYETEEPTEPTEQELSVNGVTLGDKVAIYTDNDIQFGQVVEFVEIKTISRTISGSYILETNLDNIIIEYNNDRQETHTMYLRAADTIYLQLGKKYQKLMCSTKGVPVEIKKIPEML